MKVVIKICGLLALSLWMNVAGAHAQQAAVPANGDNHPRVPLAEARLRAPRHRT